MDTANHAVRLDKLIKFVLSQRPDGSQLEHLSEAVQVSEHLGQVADHLVGHFVDQARGAGESWTAIGQAMGVSKQAAQRRFVPRADPAAGVLWTGEDERFTDRARRVVDIARDEARRTQHSAVGSLHLLLGLIAESEGLAALAIQAQGASLEQMRGAATVMVGRGSAGEGQDLTLGQDAVKALQLALREALRLGHNYIGTEHILLGMLRDSGSAATTVLNNLGIGRKATEGWILAALEGWKRAKQSE